MQPSKIRAFVAIHPPPSVVESLQACQAQLREKLEKATIRWAKPEQLHITTQFLGYLETTTIPALENSLAQVAAEHPAATLAVEGLGCFPSARQPRIIWAGLTGELENLARLKSHLDEALQQFGYMPEKRAFKPHITLGRVNAIKACETKSLQKRLTDYSSRRFGGWTMDQLDLMQSILSPAGARYVLLKSLPLNQKDR